MICSHYLFSRYCVAVAMTWLAIESASKNQHSVSFDYSLIGCAKKSPKDLHHQHRLLQVIVRLLGQASGLTWNSFEIIRYISMAWGWPFEHSRMTSTASWQPLDHQPTTTLSPRYLATVLSSPASQLHLFRWFHLEFIELLQIYWNYSAKCPEELFVVKCLASCHLSDLHSGSILCCFCGSSWCWFFGYHYQESDLLSVSLNQGRMC